MSTPEKCEECGAVFAIKTARHWTPVAILDACRAWAERHGDYPKANQWEHGVAAHPASATVIQTFGSWGAMVAAAGYEPRRGAKVWTKERVIAGFTAWRNDHGRWPTQREWNAATTQHPHFHTVRTLFGSWDAGRRAAGYRGRGRATVKTLRARGSQDIRIGSVDAAPVAVVLTRELATRPLGAVAAEVGVDPSYLQRIAIGVTPRLRTDYADRILTMLDRPDLLEAPMSATKGS